MPTNYKNQPIIFFPSREAFEAVRYKEGVKVGDAIILTSESAYNKLIAALIAEEYQQSMNKPIVEPEPGPEELEN